MGGIYHITHRIIILWDFLFMVWNSRMVKFREELGLSPWSVCLITKNEILEELWIPIFNPI
jgi:hypothetical protein